MNKIFYPRLAINNIRKNSKTYMPYILTCIGTIMMFYNMCFLAIAKNIGSLSGSSSLRSILSFGTGVIGIFSIIFLFYTNSFLIKQRKKEFGLFNILGMEKKHITGIMFFETFFIALISLTAGVLLGIVLSKLMILLLFRIIAFKVTFGFEIPIQAITTTFLLFGGIFLLNLVYNVFQVHLSKPIELLKGGNVGEKEPKTKWVQATIGTISLSAGYYIALTTESPLAALSIFFVAVVLVMTGTYCLFTAGSVAVLKMLRSNKKYYYKLNHFTSVSGMIYRMKQNAAGLSNICILSTAVIIILSTTVSMYVGIEDVLRSRYPRNIIVTASNISDEQADKLDAIINRETEKVHIAQEKVVRYRSMGVTTMQNGSSFEAAKPAAFSSNKFAMVVFVPLEEYSGLKNKSVSLSGGEALIYNLRGDIPGNTLSFNGFKLSIKERLTSFDTDGDGSAALSNSYYVVVDNVDTIKQISRQLKGKNDDIELSYFYGFDTDSGKEIQVSTAKALHKAIRAVGIDGYAQGAENSRESFFSLYGGLFFLGLFLGLLFIMATVLIIYYKQIAEGYDDKKRFEIMQKVGMSHAEVKRSIRSQVLTVFFLPLVTAVIHLAFAFKVITKLLSIFNLTNIQLFAVCTGITILVFAIFYAAVYILTSKTYYKIVS